MLTTITHVLIQCDRCPATVGEHNSPRLFSDESDALTYLTGVAGWRLLSDGCLVCPACDAAEQCAKHGHAWTDWKQCRCGGHQHGGMHPLVHSRCGWEFRNCTRCPDDDQRRTPQPSEWTGVA